MQGAGGTRMRRARRRKRQIKPAAPAVLTAAAAAVVMVVMEAMAAAAAAAAWGGCDWCFLGMGWARGGPLLLAGGRRRRGRAGSGRAASLSPGRPPVCWASVWSASSGPFFPRSCPAPSCSVRALHPVPYTLKGPFFSTLCPAPSNCPSFPGRALALHPTFDQVSRGPCPGVLSHVAPYTLDSYPAPCPLPLNGPWYGLGALYGLVWPGMVWGPTHP